MEDKSILIQCDEMTKNMMGELQEDMIDSLSKVSKTMTAEVVEKMKPMEKKINDLKKELGDFLDDNEEFQEMIESLNGSMDSITKSIEKTIESSIMKVIGEHSTVIAERNKSFNESFDFFDYDFNKAMKMVGPDGYKWRLAMREQICPHGTEEQRKQVLKNITYHAMNFMRSIQQRKTFINNHPKKIEIARRIIEARPNSKIITFSNNIKMAEAIGIGYVYTGKDSKKKGRITFNEFINMSSGILNTSKKCDEGIDIPNLSVAIMLGIDSSKIKAIREYNKTHVYDDFELDCTEGTGTECISKFLRDYDNVDFL